MPEYWNDIGELFNEALEQPVEQRSSFLERACAGNQELLREVLSLLESYEEHPEFLETPAAKITGDDEESDEEMVGQRVGPYRIAERIGRGGMGTVWLAERDDDQFQQQVAIKIVKRGMDSQEIIHRFRAERQILASLQNPNIARLLDGGIAEDGRPWLAMEYIEEGIPLNTYCKQHQLNIHERLLLFRTVCSAVAHAHQNLIVHRDLKMNNILVSKQGRVKLLDFGIAKLLSSETSNNHATEFGHRLLTPDYASPEQIRGERITTATDIYSLGVLLFELLTNHRPYRLKGLSTSEIEQVICRDEPELPSKVVYRPNNQEEKEPNGHKRQAKRLSKRLEGDLDTIVLRAMHKDPTRRYQSVEQFSDDVGRYLDGLPVRARRDSIAYRTGKFIGRHKFGITTAATLFTSITGFGGAMAIQRNRIAKQALEISKERDKAEQIAGFLKGLFSANDPAFARGKELTALEILDRGSERVEKELVDRPELQVEVMLMIGEVYLEMGAYDKAEAIFRHTLRIALQRWPDGSSLLATSQHALAASLNCRNSNYDEALELFCNAFDTLRLVHGDQLEADTTHVLNDIGLIMLRREKLNTAEQLFRLVTEMREQIFKEDHHHIAYTLNNLSIALQRQGYERFDEAIELLYRAVEMLKRLNGENHPDTSLGFYNLAQLYKKIGRIEDSERLHFKALAIRQAIFKEHRNLAFSYIRVGGIWARRRNIEEAERYLQKGLEMFRSIHGSHHIDVADALVSLARLRYITEDIEEAEQLLIQAYNIRLETLGDSHSSVTHIFLDLGHIERYRKNNEKAEEFYRTALHGFERDRNIHVHLLEECRLALVELLIEDQRLYEAATELQQCHYTMSVRNHPKAIKVSKRLTEVTEMMHKEKQNKSL